MPSAPSTPNAAGGPQPPAAPKADIWALSDLSTPWSIHVVVTLRIANHIDAGVTHIDDLAKAAGAHAEYLHRVLRHLIDQGVFEEPESGRFALNDAARALLDPGVHLGMDLDSFGGRMAYAWGSLLSAVRTGKPAYHEVFGRPFWDDLEAHPAISAKFDELMGPPGHGIPDPNVLIGGGWDHVRTVCDVGGGTGALLAEVLRAQPHVRGILVDLPPVVAKSRALLESAGVADRVTTSGQSFFDPLPPGADVYMMKNVLADWPDPEALALLKRCAEAARPSNGRVVMLGGVSPDREDDDGPLPALLMMVLLGGKERRLKEFRALAREAGLEVSAAARATLASGKPGRFIVECRPAAG